MQETPASRLLPALAAQLRSGVDLKRLLAAGALANARSFGGEDYVGFHTMMALAPAFHPADEMPEPERPLPVLKVPHLNTSRIQEHGGRAAEILHPFQPAALPENRSAGEWLRDAVRRQGVNEAERNFAGLALLPPEQAFNDLLFAVQDQTEVHRVVLPYRAWDLLGLIGLEQAHTLLRQSVRYCVKAESWPRPPVWEAPRTLLPKLLDDHKLLDRPAGDRKADDAWVDQLSRTIFESTPEQAAEAAAAALADGFSPSDVGEALTLAANQLILRDLGRPPREESPNKPVGSVHGDSIGVHAATPPTPGATWPAPLNPGTAPPASSWAPIKSPSTGWPAAEISSIGPPCRTPGIWPGSNRPVRRGSCARPTRRSAGIRRPGSAPRFIATVRWVIRPVQSSTSSSVTP